MNDWTKLIIEPEKSIRSAMQLMDEVKSKLLLVCNNNKFRSVLSIGDIQRAILSSHSLDAEINSILRDEIIIAAENDNEEEVRNLMLKHRIEAMPIVDVEDNIVNVLFWDEIFSERQGRIAKNLPSISVVIMAGGKGTRLKPITNIIPKPLIPLGEKPIVEWIIDSFHKVGVKNFYLTVNYKKEMIKGYFDNIERNYVLDYFVEDKPLGTAGSLHLLKNDINSTFFVTNCDILIKDDYSEMLEYHKKNGNELTAICAVKHFEIPYGTMEFGENGVLKSLKEKPEYNFFINAGMYILEPHLLDEIPENEFFHITTLMEKIITRKGKVGVFPVSEGSWMDIGQWDEYNKTSKKLGYEGINL